MGYRKGYYKKDGTYVQGHYANTRSRSYSNKNNGCLILLLTSMTFGLAMSCSESSESSDVSGVSNNTSNTSGSNCPTKTCGDFSSQSAAQSTYNGNKKCYKNLDSDGDGIACENLK